MKLKIQLRSKPPSDAAPENTAVDSNMVLPVNSSAPVAKTSSKPEGRPMRPNNRRCKPGLLASKPGTAPPTRSARKPPRAI